MNTKNTMKVLIYRTAAVFLIAMMLFAGAPATPAGAVSQDITSVASGTWEATAWPDTLRSGTITVTAGNQTVTGTGTEFLTELSVGNILKTTDGTQIGTVGSILSNTELTVTNIPATTRTDIQYHVQGVGPADNVTIADTHTVSIAANPANQTGTVTVAAGGTLSVSDPATVFTTVTVDGTLNATDDVSFGDLTINSGGVVNAGGNGTYTAGSLTIASGGTANISRNFTVSGDTSIAGTISFSSTSATLRAMVFAGPVTLDSGAVWLEPASGNGANNTYDFQNNFTNNAATFTASDPTSTATHTFSGTGMTISGATETSIPRVIITGAYTNNGILTVNHSLTGAGALTNAASGTLNLGGSVSIATLANEGTATKSGSGPISTALANFTNTGTLNLTGTGTITGVTNSTGGTVNLENSGAITAFDNATATSVLNISDLTPPNITTLTVSTPGNTVMYSGAGDQVVKAMAYDNLVFSGSGNKSISLSADSTLANGNLSITGTAKASITGPNLSVNSLSLGGFGKNAGTWGPSTSVATFTDDNFFALTTGYLNVATDTRLAQTISFTSTAPANAEVGGTYSPTATATSGLTVELTIDASAASVCSISGGVVSFDAAGTCVINADQAGDENYQPAPQAQQSFTITVPDTRQSQTISFTSTPPANAEVGGTYAPTATATSGLPVTLTIDASAASVCSISAGVVSFDAAGTCVINANQAGDSNYKPAPQVQQSFTIAPAPSFSDVDSDYWAYSFIERLYDAGITGGCGVNPLRYCPEGTVTRAQMAVFLLRGIHGSSYTPPAVGASTGFGDVPTNHWAAAFIKQLAAEGITAGCGGGNYCPEDPVTRAQMAVFLLRAEHGASYTPPAVGTSTGFGDVQPTYWAAAFIKQLVTEGITVGCGGGNYCPEAPVTRAQMAVFLVRTFSLP